MEKNQVRTLAAQLNISTKQVENTITLFNEGATIPFISRYRKEMTGSLDEVQIADVKNAYDKLIELDKRKLYIINVIEKQDKLSEELRNKINSIYDILDLEDLYLPYKQKRKTRAVKAKDNGLEPLAKMIFSQNPINVNNEAQKFINDNVKSVDEALQGARDIIAEQINEDKRARDIVRNLFKKYANVNSTVVAKKKDEASKYTDYFKFNQDLNDIPSHRLLAIFRAEREGLLKVKVNPDNDFVLKKIEQHYIKSNNSSTTQLKLTIADCYKRLLEPSIENEFRKSAKEKADIEAINVFSSNLRQLLLASPLGGKRILALDPGFKSGCKLVCLNENGDLMYNETIYPHPPQSDTLSASKKVASLVNSHNIEAIAIGNGTASRETEHFVRKKVKFDREVKVFVVSEDGASVYSASKIAREEFPDYDVTVRGAVSIGRRLSDPLAELVKIDAKSIGVGQYQHDVDQKMLQSSLDIVVESCVNSVGVNLNTASKYLLTYVSGLGPQIAQNIVDYRMEIGSFASRTQLKKVKRLGGKAYEQSAGFLRITSPKNPLDNTAVHPESYYIVEKMAKSLAVSTKEFLENKELRKKINVYSYVDEKTGIITIQDIMKELDKPGLDPREQIKVFEFSQEVYKIEDLKIDMELPGIVTNITKFGAFVDVGIKQDGLVHISQLADKFVSDPAEIVKLHQHVRVKIVEVDVPRKRIQLSMKGLN